MGRRLSVDATCPVCGAKFTYPKRGGPRPATCGRRGCAFAHAYPEIANARQRWPFAGLYKVERPDRRLADD